MRREEKTLDVSALTPMRWPCGPLEVEQGRARAGFSAAETATLAEWCRPEALERLTGTAVSCLVLSWASGTRVDAEQQRALRPLVAAAKKRGLALVGWIAGGDLRDAARTASAAGLDAVAAESEDAELPQGALPFRGRRFARRGPSDFLGVSGLVWPGIRDETPRGADASTGPTGPPWIDSNTWYVRLAGALIAPKALWLALEPPPRGQAIDAASYLRAIADASIYGARWVVSLDPFLRTGLSDGRPAAREAWAEIARGIAFFEARRDWTSLPPVGQLGVVSAFAGPDEFLSFEVLNLLSRQGSLYRILAREAGRSVPLDGLDAVLYVDQGRPGRELEEKLYAFAEAGGTLVLPPGWDERGAADDDAPTPRFRLFRCGRGRIALSRAELADPFLLADDAQILMSHKNDRVRAFNPGTSLLHYAASADARRGVLHAIRFDSPDPGAPLTAWFKESWSEAHAWAADGSPGVAVPRLASERGAEFSLPPVAAYCALELART
jgi:hypothetical protein